MQAPPQVRHERAHHAAKGFAGLVVAAEQEKNSVAIYNISGCIGQDDPIRIPISDPDIRFSLTH